MPVPTANLNLPVDCMDFLGAIVQFGQPAAVYTRRRVQCQSEETNWDMIRDDLVDKRAGRVDVSLPIRAASSDLPVE